MVESGPKEIGGDIYIYNEVQIIFLSKTIAFSVKLMKNRFQDLHKKINLDNFCRSYG